MSFVLEEKIEWILFISLANKQDQKNAMSKEQDLKRQLRIERLKSKHKIVS